MSRRAVAGFVAVAVAAATCVLLGLWQLRRLDDRRAYNRLVSERAAHPAAPIGSVLARPDAAYRRVTATGRYDGARDFLLFGRPLRGEPGHHVLTPLLLRDGGEVLVDRGWVPFEMSRPPVAAAAPPPGGVTVTGVLIPSEKGGAPRSRVVRAADTGAIGAALSLDLPSLYVRLEEQRPAQRDLPRPAPGPELSEGPHLSYAVQWFLFAAVAVGGWAAMMRRSGGRRAPSVPAG